MFVCLFFFVSYSGPAEIALLGVTNLNDTEEEHQSIKISERIRHPDYKLPLKYNDIALFKLAMKVLFKPHTRPACLIDTFEPNTVRTIATGWGRTETQKSSDVLLKVVLYWIPYKECNSSFKPYLSRHIVNGIIDETQICAGLKGKSGDTCQGDSGGPLQINHPNIECMYTIVGITSFGIGCDKDNLPGIYTRVFSYIDWIEGIVWPQ